jgi:indole-3-acetate monooxygenase
MTDQNKSVLEGIRELTSHIIARAAEIEAARRIPLDIVQSLKSAGVFCMFVPRSHGGPELALPTGLEAIRALGRVDGSVGWTAMIGSGSALFASLLPGETYDRIYERGPDVIFAGSSQPVGKAETTADGWRVNGR